MLKNIFKYAVIGSLVLNPLISKAEPHRADRMGLSQGQGQVQEITRADVRTEAGRQALFNFFTSLSTSEQLEYLAMVQQNHKELKKKLEHTQMQLQLAKGKDKNVRFAIVVPWALTLFLGGDLIIKGQSIAAEVAKSNTFKSMNPKFLKGGIVFSGVMVVLGGFVLANYGQTKFDMMEADMQRLSSSIGLINEELEFERNMIDLLKAYSESNQ